MMLTALVELNWRQGVKEAQAWKTWTEQNIWLI